MTIIDSIDAAALFAAAEAQNYAARRKFLTTGWGNEAAQVADPVEARRPDTSGIDLHPERMSPEEIAELRRCAAEVIAFCNDL